jgi:hypothetical protein
VTAPALSSRGSALTLLRGQGDQLTRARYMLRRAQGERALKGLKARYGATFPGFAERAAAWVAYVDWLWATQDSPMQDRIYLAEKLGLFREGHQWITTVNGRWETPKAPRNVVRATVNMIGPAQDYRLGVLEEQPPGWRVIAHGQTAEDRDAAEAQQLFCEWLYFRRGMLQKLKAAMRYAQDFGVGALQAVWNTSLGQRREARITLVDENGDEIERNLDERGRVVPEGVPPHVYTEGDVDFVPIRGDQLRCDPEALTVADCRWLQIRRLRPVSELIFEHGDKALQAEASPFGRLVSNTRGTMLPLLRRDREGRDEIDRFGDLPITEESDTYLAPSDFLPEGLFIVCAGNQLLHIGPLPFGAKTGIPVARFTDGGTEADFFPRPAGHAWVDDQIAINALASRILQNARINSGGRLLAYQGSVVKDTYTNTLGSIVEWKGATPPQWLQSAQIGQDTWQALQFHINELEKKSGWNDVARGAMTPSTPESGRGILAIREQNERGVSPFLRAGATGMSEWARLACHVAAWGYQRPRLLPIVGEDRPDLVRFISSADLERQTDIRVDPESMMPIPRPLRLQMLREELELGSITHEEYRRRNPYANIRNLDYADSGHYARAKRINFDLEQMGEQIAAGQVPQPPVFWQDDAGIHQRVLQELILDDRKPATVRRLAASRWDYYALLNQAQQGDPNATMQVKALIDQLMPGGPLPPPPVPQLPAGMPPQPMQQGAPGGQGGGQVVTGGSPFEAASQNALGQAQNPAAAFEAAAPQ